MERQISDVSVNMGEKELNSFRLKMGGSDGTKHFVSNLDGEWNCDCMGFTVRKACRHVKAGEILMQKLAEGIVIVNQQEIQNWQK